MLIIVIISIVLTAPGNIAGKDEVEGPVDQRLSWLYTAPQVLEPFFTLSQNSDDIRFLLHNNKSNINDGYELHLDDPTSLQQSSFDPKLPTILIIHGFWTNSESLMPTTMTKAFLEADSKFNIIKVDWGLLSTPRPKNILWSLAYVLVAKNSRIIVSERISNFLRFLISSNYAQLENVHIIAHSMGAHIAGRVGRLVFSFSEAGGKKLGRISAFDPAGPLFNFLLKDEKLTKEDANFVDIYHTAAGSLGIISFTDGHVNFLVNGGTHQPGCDDPKNFIFGEAEYGSCSHNFATKVYAASITRDFIACECQKNPETKLECPANCSVNVVAGYRCPLSSRGQYYLAAPENVYSEI